VCAVALAVVAAVSITVSIVLGYLLWRRSNPMDANGVGAKTKANKVADIQQSQPQRTKTHQVISLWTQTRSGSGHETRGSLRRRTQRQSSHREADLEGSSATQATSSCNTIECAVGRNGESNNASANTDPAGLTTLAAVSPVRDAHRAADAMQGQGQDDGYVRFDGMVRLLLADVSESCILL
jgi:hypothetical protein